MRGENGRVVENKNKFLRRIWQILLLLLPTIASVIGFFIIYNNVFFSSQNIYDIKLYDTQGNLVASERNFIRTAEKDGIISLLSPITENLNTVSNIPEYFDKRKHFKADVSYMNTKKEYDFYFSSTDVIGYCVFDSQSYLIGESDTKKFLSSRFSESIYDSSVPPQMFTISGELVAPKAVSWKYSLASGDYAIASNYTATDKVISYDMSGSLGLSFDKAPSDCTVTITKGTNTVFEGDYEDISQLTFERGENVRVNVDALWRYSIDTDCYGSISYEFDVTVSDRADFYITGNSFSGNSFCGIFCSNVKDPSKIIFECTPDIPEKTEFRNSHGTAIALLPISRKLNIGEYVIKLTYGATTESFVIKVNKISVGVEIDLPLDYSLIKKAFSSFISDDFEELISFVGDNSSGEKMFHGKFLDYTNMGAELIAFFGDSYVTGYRNFYSYGHEYRFTDQVDACVPVLNSGKVIKVGYNDYIGNFVIVSHGCGLATWYTHLSTIDIGEGSYVVRGESVGKTGVTGLSYKENVFIMASIGDEFINPVNLCGKQYDY